MILTYDAVTNEGKQKSDSIEASNTKNAIEQLRRRGLFVTKIEENKSTRPALQTTPTVTGSLRLPLTTLALMTRQMAMLLRSGSGVVPAVAAIKRQMNKPQQAALLQRIIDDLEEGSTLTDALRHHPGTFNSVYCAIVAAGEASATLPDMFERLAQIVGSSRAMRNKIIGTLVYPLLLIGMCSNILLGLIFFVLPRFEAMFTQLGAETPAVTRALLGFGVFMRTYWMGVPVLLIVTGGTIVWLIRSVTGKQWLANIQIRIPIIGRLRSRLIQGVILRTMGMLLESSVGVLDSLALVRESTKNNRYQRLFDQMENSVTGGGQLSNACEESGLIEPYICQAIKTGEDSGKTGAAMSYCADVLDETNAELLTVVTRMLEPVILIGMGAIVGTVAVSLFIPLFDLTSAMH